MAYSLLVPSDYSMGNCEGGDLCLGAGQILNLPPGVRITSNEIANDSVGEAHRVDCEYCDGPRSMTERTCPGCGAP